MKGLLVGDTFFVGSRNLTPTRALGYHVPTRKVVCTKAFGPGWTVQALAQHGGSVVYAGLVGAADGEPNIWKWDLTTNEVTPLATIDGLFVRALATAPDGMLYAVGKEDRPGIHVIDPRTGAHRVLAVPDPKAVQALCLSVTDRYVFFGAGSNLAGGGDASSASVFVVNRRTGECRSILPPELAADPATRDLAVIGKQLYVGTVGAAENGWFAVFSLADYTMKFSVRTQAKWCANFIKIGGKVYFNGGGLCRYDIATSKYVTLPNTDSVEGGGLGHLDGTIVTANADRQAMIHYQIATRKVTSVDLVDAGATPDPQLGMSVAADTQRVYVGGTGSVDLHRLANASVRKVWIPGECKEMVLVDGMLIAGVYSSRGIWAYDPRGKLPPTQLISLPQEQNRPRALVWDAFLALLLVGLQSDTLGGGALAVCDLEGRHLIRIRPEDT
jgi:hypothetical protein